MKDWKKDLGTYLEGKEKKKRDEEEKIKKKKSEVKSFYSLKVIPAFKELKTEFEKRGREVKVNSYKDSAAISVVYEGKEELSYLMKVAILSPDCAIPCALVGFIKKDGKTEKVLEHIRSGPQNYDISDISKDEIIQHLLDNYYLSEI